MHAIIILGVSFNLVDDSDPDSLSTMEITLVHNRAEEEPEDADYLAQANQLGGGNVEEKVRDSSPFSNTAPTQEQGIAPASVRDLAPPPIPVKQAQEELMTVDKSRLQEASQPQHDPLPIPPENVTAAQLFERSQEIARLSAKIEEIRKSYAVTPRQTYVRGANAREFRFASYMDAWRTKVERIGNLNYPEEAARRGISGALLMDVAINPDGSLYSVRVLRTSGHKVLDEAAVRIVKLAAPYPPLSEDILQDTDILHIPRVWQFESGGGLMTRAQ
ncbi:MAG: energy transducer TonB [Halobacteria archaeon]|nr:energy transducer TonB [Halobacteria archaeon]